MTIWVIKLGHGMEEAGHQMLMKIWGMLLVWLVSFSPVGFLAVSRFLSSPFCWLHPKNKWHRILGGALDILSHLTSWGFDVWTPQNLPIKHHQTSCSDVFKDVYSPVNKHSNGKSPSWIGKTSSNGGFSIAMLDYRSVPGDSSRDLFGDGEFTWPILGVVGDLQRSRIKGHGLNHHGRHWLKSGSTSRWFFFLPETFPHILSFSPIHWRQITHPSIEPIYISYIFGSLLCVVRKRHMHCFVCFIFWGILTFSPCFQGWWWACIYSSNHREFPEPRNRRMTFAPFFPEVSCNVGPGSSYKWIIGPL